MAKIPRVTQKVFASAASNNGVFGSAQAGTPTTSSDIAVLMGEAAYLQGWLDATLGASKFPPLEEFQALDYINTTQLAYLFEEGVPEYDPDTTYWVGGICKEIGGFKLYGSLTNSNIGNALSDTVNWQLLIDFSNQRQRLTANADYYVSTTGNNSNAGTLASPWLTIQYAINYVANYIDLSGYNVTIHVADGTYAAGASVTSPWVGTGSVILTGNTTTPANCIISSGAGTGVSVGYNGRLSVEGFKLQGTTGSGMAAFNGGEIIVSGKMDFGSFTLTGSTNAHMVAYNTGNIYVAANYNITGANDYHILSLRGGSINSSGYALTVTITGTPAFGNAFAASVDMGMIVYGGHTFSGSATGTRYSSTNVSLIDTNGGGANYFPGNGAGSTANGGVYV